MTARRIGSGRRRLIDPAPTHKSHATATARVGWATASHLEALAREFGVEGFNVLGGSDKANVVGPTWFIRACARIDQHEPQRRGPVRGFMAGTPDHPIAPAEDVRAVWPMTLRRAIAMVFTHTSPAALETAWRLGNLPALRRLVDAAVIDLGWGDDHHELATGELDDAEAPRRSARPSAPLPARRERWARRGRRVKRSMRRRPIRELVCALNRSGFQPATGRYRWAACGRRVLASRVTADLDQVTCARCILRAAAAAFGASVRVVLDAVAVPAVGTHAALGAAHQFEGGDRFVGENLYEAP